MGETRKIEITEVKIDYEGDLIKSEGSARTPVDLHVYELYEDGYVLRWTNGRTEIESPSVESDPFVEAMTNLAYGMMVEYETDSSGVVTSVRNWEEIAMLLQESLDMMANFFEGSGMSESEYQPILDSVEQMFSTKEQIEAFAIDHIQIYHLAYGWDTLELSSPVFYDVLLPNPFGGDPFPGILQLELVDFNPDAGQAVLNWTQTLDPDSARQILMDTLTDMAATMGSEPPTESDLPEPFSIEDRAVIHVDPDSGWIQRLEYTKKVVVGPTSREEITRIVDVSN